MKDIKLPMSEADARSLQLGEMITVSGLLFTGRSRFHIRAACQPELREKTLYIPGIGPADHTAAEYSDIE